MINLINDSAFAEGCESNMKELASLLILILKLQVVLV
jgi:hypothetical protein